MGEAVLSCQAGIQAEIQPKVAGLESEMEMEMHQYSSKGDAACDADGCSVSATAASSRVVRWERFLPNMVLRVLLVEADDSTRQIITALLRKCSYRVAAVSDGLKAWELLKRRPRDIDLILTEVDLPSISGYALLTLIMEHKICKNIPVIMMSSQDSVSTVYKCMLRGASDFLVKPVRKNELRNLWQHVWRRQASSGGGPGPPDESVAQQKVEATAENNDTSNNSSANMACIQRNRERTDKGSDAQSSCTKPEMDTEGADVECMRGYSQPEGIKSSACDIHIQKQEVANASKDLQIYEAQAAGPQAAIGVDCETSGREDINTDEHWQHRKFITETPDSHALTSPSREAIDLIGAFDNYLKCNYGSFGSNNGASTIDSSPLLDLSLRRSQLCGSVNQVMDKRQRLNHSDASAFSRYVNRTFQPRTSRSPSTCNQQDYETNFDKQLSSYTLDYSSDARAQTVSSQKQIPLATSQPGQTEIAYSRAEQRVLRAPVPVRGVRFDNLSSGYGPVIPQVFCMQSGMIPAQSPGLAGHQQADFQANTFHPNPQDQEARNLQQHNSLRELTNTDATGQSEHKQEHKMEALEDRGYFSSANEQSTNSSFGNCAVSHLHSINYGSDGKVNNFTINDDALENPTHDANSHRIMQREAALNKFRLKRKERCYEKKVRYESRKKLAEQRPRVKGQFVRQGHYDRSTGCSADK